MKRKQKKGKGLDINDLNSASSQNALVKMLSKNKKPVIAVLLLFVVYVATTIVTWYMFFTR